MLKRLLLAFASIVLIASVAFAETHRVFTRTHRVFTSVSDALVDVRDQDAVEYLKAHPEESAEPLMKMVNEKQGTIWYFAASALAKTKDPRVYPFFADLFEKWSADRNKKESSYLRSSIPAPGDPDMEIAAIVVAFGELGDNRASPILQKAKADVSPIIRRQAYASLYRIGELSLDGLIAAAKKNRDPAIFLPFLLVELAQEAAHDDCSKAIVMCDAIIKGLADNKMVVGGAENVKRDCARNSNREEALQATPTWVKR